MKTSLAQLQLFCQCIFLLSNFTLHSSNFRKVGQEELESPSAVLQTAAKPSQLPTRDRNLGFSFLAVGRAEPPAHVLNTYGLNPPTPNEKGSMSE